MYTERVHYSEKSHDTNTHSLTTFSSCVLGKTIAHTVYASSFTVFPYLYDIHE